MTIGMLFNATGILSFLIVSMMYGMCVQADQLLINRNIRYNYAPYEIMKIADICLESEEKNLELTLEQIGGQSNVEKSDREYLSNVMNFQTSLFVNLDNLNISSSSRNGSFMNSISSYSSLLADRVERLELNFQSSTKDGPEPILDKISDGVKCLNEYLIVLLHSSQCRIDKKYCVAPDTHTPDEYKKKIGGDDSCAIDSLTQYKLLYNCIRDIDSLANNMLTVFDQTIKAKTQELQNTLKRIESPFKRIQSKFPLEGQANLFEMVNEYYGHKKSPSLIRLHCDFLRIYSLSAIGKNLKYPHSRINFIIQAICA